GSSSSKARALSFRARGESPACPSGRYTNPLVPAKAGTQRFTDSMQRAGFPLTRERAAITALVRELLHRAAGDAGDEAVEKEIIRDRHRDGGDQRAGHELAPIEH